MPNYGPLPRQFSQATSTQQGQAIVSQPVLGTEPEKSSPAYDTPRLEVYLGQGIFGNFSDPDQAAGDSVYPDLSGDFETYDRVEAFSNGQSVDIAWSGRLGSSQDKLARISVNVVGDDAGFITSPPTFVLKVYVDGAGGSNPVFESAVTDAPSTITEFVIVDSQLTDQPTGQKRYHIVLEAAMDSGQKIDCSRPFVTQE